MTKFPDNLFFLYQPKFYNDKIFGYEALLRANENNTPVLPIKLLIENKGNTLFDYFIINSVINDLVKLPTSKINNLLISINVSASLFSTPIDFSLINFELINKFNLKLDFEILESDSILDYEICNNNIKQLKKVGISVSIDDFGKGDSSIRRLININNINFIKVDKVLIDDLIKNQSIVAKLRLLFNFINQLNVKIIVEGIEDKKTLNALQGLGIQYFQGFYLSKPHVIH
ncbi:EAL domain-containing protein [Photobacterium leiognathi]|uniref:EAL domain-containing protein n=1 Tax=Photobacterium leiognathi TaxID=553611 RepID=UPI002980D577|nr:EAL domain-containing protein [Photobacterium leiognathi]